MGDDDSSRKLRVAVIGGGLSGLSAAYELGKNPLLHVDLFERSDHLGGIVSTTEKDGFLFELGPQSMNSKHDEVEDVIRDLDLVSKKVFRSGGKSVKTLIIRDGKPVELKLSPGGFFSSRLLSFRAKLSLFLEPFKRKSNTSDLSIDEFSARRFGRETTDYLVDPMMSGVNGGSLSTLSAKYALPTAWNAEQTKGSVILGMFGAKKKHPRKYPAKLLRETISFDQGLKVLPETLVEKSKAFIHKRREVKKLCLQEDGRWNVGHWSPYDAVISTAPTYSLQQISTCRNTRLRELLSDLSTLSYSAISILFLGFKDVTSRIPLSGFGCLAPTRESRSFLGMTFTTSNFEGRTPEGGIGVNVFLGGGRKPKQARLSQDEAVAMARHELHELFGIEEAPQTVAYRQWLRAIPQYELGYGFNSIIAGMQAHRCNLLDTSSEVLDVFSRCSAGMSTTSRH